MNYNISWEVLCATKQIPCLNNLPIFVTDLFNVLMVKDGINLTMITQHDIDENLRLLEYMKNGKLTVDVNTPWPVLLNLYFYIIRQRTPIIDWGLYRPKDVGKVKC